MECYVGKNPAGANHSLITVGLTRSRAIILLNMKRLYIYEGRVIKSSKEIPEIGEILNFQNTRNYAIFECHTIYPFQMTI